MRVIETSLDEDLSLFSGYLWQRQVTHRVFEERGSQVLEVADDRLAGPVRDAYQAWKSGSLHIEALPRRAAPARWPSALLRYPGLTVLIGLALAAFPFSYALGQGEVSTVAAWLTIVDPRQPMSTLPSLPGLLAEGQVWRWFTPMLLHFSVLHLGFDCAITIELGRRVERRLGALGLWLVVLTIAGISDLAQYALGATPLFGGLSGVAYGLLGFILIMARLAPEVADWHLPAGLGIVLLVFLVVFTTGITRPFGLYVANAAHWSGLGTGAAVALILGGWRALRA